jgi:multidrug efflux pump subunit AcrA (membrane-fusion protein)
MVNQAESELIRIGQPATIAFDAFPGLTLPGKVAAVGAMAVSSGRVNYYIRSVPVRVRITGQDPRVIPDLSASGDVVLWEKNESLVVPREAVHEDGGKPVIYVKQANAFAPRQVQLGSRSNTRVAVTSGLNTGEEIALQPSLVLNR